MEHSIFTRFLRYDQNLALENPFKGLLLAYAIVVNTFSEDDTVSINISLEENDLPKQLRMDLASNYDIGALMDGLEKQIGHSSESGKEGKAGDQGNVWKSSCIVPFKRLESIVERSQTGAFPVFLACGHGVDELSLVLKQCAQVRTSRKKMSNR